MSAKSQPTPANLVIPIIEDYTQGIRPAFAFILISAAFGSILVPLLILLFALSTPQTRRKPIFILNVLAVGLGILAAGLCLHLTIASILSPFKVTDPTETTRLTHPDITFTILGLWMAWFSESVLLLRITVIFPRAQLPLLLAFPITIKAARVVIDIIFSVQWAKLLLLAGAANQFEIVRKLPRWIIEVGVLLELFDNGYVSALFLWRLRLQTRRSVLGDSVSRANGHINHPNPRDSYSGKLQRLFWIASTNFIFPCSCF
ncbi:hypothetical protein C8R44DRAFT_862135 [Mycena epipterygia]|nr:hypothetical protein C8R44DRAFT_862135 [Mycena epipterygia]